MAHKDDFLGEVFIETVQIQINENDPPVVRQTYDRLKKGHYNDYDAIRIIAAVLASETLEMMKEKRHFDATHYAEMLQKLPKMPWD